MGQKLEEVMESFRAVMCEESQNEESKLGEIHLLSRNGNFAAVTNDDGELDQFYEEQYGGFDDGSSIHQHQIEEDERRWEDDPTEEHKSWLRGIERAHNIDARFRKEARLLLATPSLSMGWSFGEVNYEWMIKAARLIDEVKADEFRRAQKSVWTEEYFEEFEEAMVATTNREKRISSGEYYDYEFHRGHRSGKKRDKFALWVGRNSQPKSGLLPNSRVADRLNRIANRGGKPPKRLRRYNGYRAEYGQAIFMKQLEQSIAKINEVLAE